MKTLKKLILKALSTNIASRFFGCSLFIITFAFLSLGQAVNKTKDCSQLLTKNTYDFSALDKTRESLHRSLGAGADPFQGIVDFDETYHLLNQLSHSRDANGKLTPNILSLARSYLRRGSVTLGETVDLTKRVVAYTSKSFNERPISRKSLLTALTAADIIDSFSQQYREVKEQVENKEEQKEEQAKQDKKQKSKKPKSPPPAFAPELPPEYNMTNNNNNNNNDGESSSQEKAVFYEFNDKVFYFKQLDYNLVTRNLVNFKLSALPLRQDETVESGYSSLQMKVVTKGSRQMKLFLPDNFEPLSPKDSSIKVIKRAEGHYDLILDKAMEDIVLPMTKRTIDPLTASDYEVLTSPIGVPDKEWPKDIQLHLLDKKFGGVHATATAVADFIKTKYLYSKKAKALDPIEALNAGQFKCDMAALIMTGIMRDHFKMPCRPVGGYRAERRASDSRPHSLLVLPTDPHAWVECNDNGEWKTFDPTPVKKAPGEKSESEESEFVPQDESDEQPLEANSETSDSSVKQAKAKNEKGKTKAESTKENKNKKNKKEEAGESDNKSSSESTDELQLGTMSLKKSGGSSNPLIRELIQNFYRESYSPHLTQSQIIQNLSVLNSVKLGQGWGLVDNLLSESLPQLSSSRPQVSQHLRAIAARLKSIPIEDSYKEFFSSWFRTRAYDGLITDTVETPRPQTLMSEFDKTNRLFRAMESDEAKEVKMAIAFLRSLPKITRSVVLKDFNIEAPGNNPATKRLGAKLRDKQMSSYALIRQLYPLTDFITEPVPSPLYLDIKTWNYQNRRGRDYMTMTDPSRLMHGIMQNPSKSRSENFRSGTMTDPRRRQISKLPSPKGVSEPERITWIAYDTSGSMSGAPGDFQAALIAAFADRALSDVTPDGRRHLHRLLISGFDDKVHSPKSILSTSDAQNLIRNYRHEMTNTGGGTDIMAAITEGFKQIELAQAQKGEPLANANIILMSDGQSEIDVGAIKKMREKIDRKTKVQFLFVAIGSTNPDLQEFCMSDAVSKVGCSKSPYYEFPTETISQSITKAVESQNKLSEDIIVTDKKSQDVSEELVRQLVRTADVADQYERSITLRRKPNIKLFYDAVDTQMNLNLKPSADRKLRIQINDARALLASKQQLKRHSNYNYVTANWLLRFEKLTGKKLNQLNVEEAEELKHLIREIYANQ